MARILVWLLIVVVLVGGAIWIAGRSTDKPVVRIEKAIPVDAPGR